MSLDLEGLDLPDAVLAKLVQLAAHTDFEAQGEKGANGYLFFGTNLVSGLRVAVKFYFWAGDHAYHAEPRQLAALDSPNIARVLDAGLADEEWAYFVTPYYELGDLDDEIRLGHCDTWRSVEIARELLNGLSFLHAARLLHRDLKPQNIFVADGGGVVIGDFGSVKRIPDGQSTVPGSGHALLYRPPESIDTNVYGVPGDIYQSGIILFQLLGGRLPYDETEWLRPRELARYKRLETHADRSIYATEVIKLRIARGQVVDVSTLPPWVCNDLKHVISRACSVRPGRRFQSCAEMLGKLGQIHPRISKWAIEGGCPTRRNGATYRIVESGEGILQVQKRRRGDWRNDNTIDAPSLAIAVQTIEDRCR